jgi:hypothetical protein
MQYIDPLPCAPTCDRFKGHDGPCEVMGETPTGRDVLAMAADLEKRLDTWRNRGRTEVIS